VIRWLPDLEELQDESGFTLVELTVVIMLLAVVGGIVSSVMISSMQQAARQEDRTRTLIEAKVAMERVTREIRGANEIKSNLASSLNFETRFTDPRGLVVRTTTLAVVPVTGDTVLQQTDVDRVVTTGVVEPARVRKVLGGLDAGRSQAFFCYGTGDGAPIRLTPTPTPGPTPAAGDPDANTCTYDVLPATWRKPTPSETRTIEVKIRIKQQGAGKASRLNQLISVRNLED